ncbi:MAG: TonB-dependent receptor [Muribaculaceae bacterium]|nr:TonB-dependent receptor [Muribaculaceae bacterium]
MKINQSVVIGRLWLVLMLIVIHAAPALALTVKGIVTDPQHEPLIGVAVTDKDNPSNGTMTDLDGNFTINVDPDATLVFSYTGFYPADVAVEGRSSFEVVLRENAELLDEVVVIGYQTIRKKDLTGSVSSINSADIVAAPVSNVAQALQGKLAGVNIVSQDGRPDANISIRVRGGGSISQSNEPLILIDGVAGTLSDIPSDQVERIDVLKDASSTAIYGARGANGVILVTTKGAKEGKFRVNLNGYVKWDTPTKYLKNLDTYDYLSFVWANADVNGAAYRTPFEKLFGLEDGGILNYRGVEAEDLQRDVYNNSFSQNYDLSVTGGNENTQIYFGFNFTDNEGMKVNSYYKRAGATLKVNQKLWKGVTLGIDTRYSQVKAMGDEGTTSGSGSWLSRSYRFRTVPSWAIEKFGDMSAMREGNIDNFGREALWETYNAYNMISDYEPLKERQTIRGNVNLTWEIIKGLMFRTEVSLHRSWNQNKIWSGAVYNGYLDEDTNEPLWAGAAELYKGDSWSARWTNTLSYDVEFGDIHHLNAVIGQEVSDSHGSSMTMKADHFPANFTKDNAFAMINQYDSKNNTQKNPFNSGISIPGRIQSYFGRVNYSVLDRYMLTLTMRADGSSKFSPKNRWGYFPAAALAWRVSEEEFFSGARSWWNDLKFRVSYGEVGNDGISADLWSQNWTSENDTRWQAALNGIYQASYDLASSTMANPDLKWETTITRNIGLDFGFLENRITATVDAYWNTTKDLLMLTQLPGITGFTTTYANVGQTSNRGVEISLRGTIFQNRDWSVVAGANINFNRNKVDRLSDGVTGIYGTHWIAGSSPDNDYLLKEGKGVGLVYGFIYDGIYTTDDFNYTGGQWILKDGVTDINSSLFGSFHGADRFPRPEGQGAVPGMPKFKKTQDDGTNVVTEADKVIIGDMNPDATGGFNINVNWRSFDLGAYFNWSYGNQVYNVNKLASLYGYKERGVYENKLDLVRNCYRWYDIDSSGNLVALTSPEQLAAANASASLPTPYNEQGIVSSLGVEDASYLRLNTLTLGYTLPKKLTTKVGIQNLRFYASCYNLFTITSYDGLDPEVNANSNLNHAVYPTTGLDWGTYPRARSYVLGVNINF